MLFKKKKKMLFKKKKNKRLEKFVNKINAVCVVKLVTLNK